MNVDAIVFWMVWNAEKCILEVENFVDAINMSAQTALRESIGRHELAQMITEREILGRELQRILDEKTNPWGITVQSVEIRDVKIPQALEDAMSRQAQAERERQARNILGQAETEIADKFAQVTVAIEPAKKAILLSSRNPDVGEQTSNLRATITGDAATMNFDSLLGDEQRLADLSVGVPAGDVLEDLALSIGEGRDRPARLRQAPHAALA